MQKEKNSLIICNKPDINNSKGFWVALNLSIKNGKLELGKVHSVNSELRLIDVMYIERKDSYSEYNLNSKLFPFDHPSLEWYHTNRQLPVIPSINFNTSVCSEDDGSPKSTARSDKYVLVEAPTLVDSTKGYFVSYSSNDKEMNRLYGKVVGKDILKRLIAVNFKYDEQSPRNISHFWIPFDHPKILWVILFEFYFYYICLYLFSIKKVFCLLEIVYRLFLVRLKFLAVRAIRSTSMES